MTLQQILENENIKADRFGMAAISYIFKAFGDNIRSKEYWPWGDKVDFPWDNGKDTISSDKIQDALNISNWTTYGNLSDLTRAMLCLKEAQVRSHEEEHIEIKRNNSNSIKDLKKRLDRINMSVKDADTLSQNINETSTEYEEKGNNIN